MPKGEVVPVPILCSVTFGAPHGAGAGRGQARLPRTRARRRAGAAAAVDMSAPHDGPAHLHRRPAGGPAVRGPVRRLAAGHRGRPRCWRCAAARTAATPATSRLLHDLRALWVGALVFWVAWVSGPVGATLAFGAFSFLALREFITLAHTRRSDHRSLMLAFFVVLPLQFVLAGSRSFDLFTVFIPVYVFLAIPVRQRAGRRPRAFPRAQRQDPVGHHGLRLRAVAMPRRCCCWNSRATKGAAPSWCSSW